MAGPRGFEPRISGSGGLRTVPFGRFGALSPCWATGPSPFEKLLCYIYVWVLLVLGAYEGVGLLNFWESSYVADDSV